MRLMLAFGVALACGACSSLPANIEREPSYAFAEPESTPLGQAFLPAVIARGGESGFVPVVAGANAFLLRAAMAGLARHTLDLQYYIWEDDLTGRMMLQDVLGAAERGVRVRLLLDDIDTNGDTAVFTRVDAHPNVEVRLFNPFTRRDVRAADWLLDGARLNHRMHNKVMIADNAIAITGGRNIGDHYFTVDEVSNFRDLDLLAIGPIVQELSSMFDLYWNSGWSYPIHVIDKDRYTPADAAQFLEQLDRGMPTRLPFAEDGSAGAMRGRLLSHMNAFAWGRARAIFDAPAALRGEAAEDRNVATTLVDTIGQARQELLIETAYFIPGDSGIEMLTALVARGVHVAVLTNSLATNDVVAAHAGYMDYREDLLLAGIELYELRPDALAHRRHATVLASDSDAALHSKVLVRDRDVVFVGSFNLDPRSLLINTEMGVLVESRELAADVATIISAGLDPANSYRLVLRDGELKWLQGGEHAQFLDTEPATTWWERFVANFISLLPINGQL